MSGGKGVLVGGVVGGVIGLLGSTVLLPLGIGAATVGLAAKLRDSRIPERQIERSRRQAQTGRLASDCCRRQCRPSSQCQQS